MMPTTPDTRACDGCTFDKGCVLARPPPGPYSCLSRMTAAEAQKLENPGANATQVGGDHYRKYRIQPWDYIAENGLDFFQGSIIAYVTRFKDKGGVEDLKKARHFLDKLIEVESAR